MTVGPKNTPVRGMAQLGNVMGGTLEGTLVRYYGVLGTSKTCITVFSVYRSI